MAKDGNLSARLVLKHLNNLQRFNTSYQFGVTVTSLVLGWAIQSFMADRAAWFMVDLFRLSCENFMIISVIIKGFCYILAFSITALIKFIFAALILPNYANSRLEKVVLSLIHPFEWWCYITNVVIDLLTKTVSDENVDFTLEQAETINRICDFADTKAMNVMTPKIAMTCVEVHTTISDFVQVALKFGHSRLPVYDKSFDNILGLIYLGAGIKGILAKQEAKAVSTLALENVLTVKKHDYIGEIIIKLNNSKCNMAIVKDSDGTIIGLITFADLIDKIVEYICAENGSTEKI